MKNLNRDEIDFGKTSVPKLFAKLLVPTLLGMLFMSAFNIADGIFVGKGVSSTALAAVNVSAPVYLFSTAVTLMFASGMSIVAAIHLSQKNAKAANINFTQSIIAPLVVMAIFSAIILLFPERLNYLFGGSDVLLPYVKDYLRGLFLIPVLSVFLTVGTFAIRLDGSPKMAMSVNIVSALTNCFLDWLFIFPLDMGVFGAAFATSISELAGALMVIVYFVRYSKELHFYKLKWTNTSLYLGFRNIRYMMKLGFSTFLGEIAIAASMIVGNYRFIHYLKEDGVAAYSVCCYLLPLIFMFGNSIANSQLPILSYNNGLKNGERIRKTIRLSVGFASILGILLVFACISLSDPLLTLFLNPGTNAFRIAKEGFPYYVAGFFFITLNLVGVGIYQGLEKAKCATAFTLLRGIILVIPCFILLPIWIGEKGLWLSIPAAEMATFVLMAIYTIWRRYRSPRNSF